VLDLVNPADTGRRLFGRAGKAGLDEDSRAGWNTLTQHGRLFNGRSVRVESGRLQYFRQLRKNRRDARRLVAREQLAAAVSACRFLFEIHVGKGLPVQVLHHKTAVQFFDGPGRREVPLRHQNSGDRDHADEGATLAGNLYPLTSTSIVHDLAAPVQELGDKPCRLVTFTAPERNQWQDIRGHCGLTTRSGPRKANGRSRSKSVIVCSYLSATDLNVAMALLASAISSSITSRTAFRGSDRHSSNPPYARGRMI
jgi:hypothetical protein